MDEVKAATKDTEGSAQKAFGKELVEASLCFHLTGADNTGQQTNDMYEALTSLEDKPAQMTYE